MTKTKSLILFIIFISLAAIGLISRLIISPGAFIRSLLLSIVIMGIIGFVFYKFVSNRGNQKSMNSSQNKKYKAAVKQSQKKYRSKKQTNKTKINIFKKSASPRKQKSLKNHKHLKVIDGTKSNKKSEKHK